VPLEPSQDPWAGRLRRLLETAPADPVYVLTTPVPSATRFHRAYARVDGTRCVVITEQMPDAIAAAIDHVRDPAQAYELQFGGYEVQVYGRRATAGAGPIGVWVPRTAQQGARSRAVSELPLLVNLLLAWETRDPGEGFPEFSDPVVLFTASAQDFPAPVSAARAEEWAGAVFDTCFASALRGSPPEDFQGVMVRNGLATASAPSWISSADYPGAKARTRKGAGGCTIELTAPMVDQERIVTIWRRRALALKPTKLRSPPMVGAPTRYTIKGKRPDGSERTVKLVLEARYADSFYGIKIGRP
jgi:hypothetical protein